MKFFNDFRKPALCVSCFILLSNFAAHAQDYTVGVPVCDTISTVTSYTNDGPCPPVDTLKVRLGHQLIPYVSGLQFQFHITAINGNITSNVSSDTVQAGDVFLLPAPVASGILKFVLPVNSSFKFITKIVGTPLVANESYYCDVKNALTAAICGNSVAYFTTGRQCKVKPFTSVKDFKSAPEEYALTQNYPNPFNPETKIDFHLTAPALVTVKIYNSLGQPIRTLFNGKKPAGVHRLSWDGRDHYGRRVNSGVYFYTLNAGKFRQTRKMLFFP